jgi:hypothetical protein
MRLMRNFSLLLLITVAAVSAFAQEGGPDYRSRTIYFLLTDRFNPHHPFDPYIDPLFPDATNSVDCFTETCSEEEEFRKYWGGDIRGFEEKLDYIKRLGASAIWVTPTRGECADVSRGHRLWHGISRLLGAKL